MTYPVFSHTDDWVKLMADYLQESILTDSPLRYSYNDTFIPVIFLAGAPWAGKTEWIESFPDIEHYVILDTDLYRSLFEGYTGSNASEFHQYASRVMDRMYSFCIKHGYNMIVDGTFSNQKKIEENIVQCEKKGVAFSVVLVMQNPIISYLYMKKREQEKLRNVPTEAFIEKYYRSIEVVKDIFIHFPIARVYIARKVAAWKYSFARVMDHEHFDKLTISEYLQKELNNRIKELSSAIHNNPHIVWHLLKNNSNISKNHDL